MKRRRYRERKKQKLKSSFHCDKPYKVDIDKAICIYKEGHEETGCHCHTLEIEESEPDNRWQTFEKEEEEMREKISVLRKHLKMHMVNMLTWNLAFLHVMNYQLYNFLPTCM